MAGLVASILLAANIILFAALMFPGELSVGIPTAMWALLVGSCIGGIWIALATSIPPIATGIDSPTGAVLVLLSAAVGSKVIVAGSTPEIAVQIVMLTFTAATLLSGALLYFLGTCRWGSYFRFVPYSVVGGFLGATGWLLIAGGVQIATGRQLGLSIDASDWTKNESIKLLSAAAVLIVLLALRRWVRSTFSIPTALIVMSVAGGMVVQHLGLSGWYLPTLGALSEWSPFEAIRNTQVTWSMMAKLTPELLTVTIVALISLVTKVSSLEVAREISGDLNREFRAHGIASLVAAPFGGIAANVQTGTSRVLEHAGGATRMSGVVSAIALGAVAFANFDLPALVPTPVIAGLVFYLGGTFITDGLWRPFIQRAWLDLVLAAGIMAICIEYGYLFGVLAGLLCACVLFAMSYARVGVIRRHVTRAQYASYVDRSTKASAYLREMGDSIQLYWLSGYIFFGSSEGVFERIHGDIKALKSRSVRYIILDFGMVSGADSSTLISLTKLRNFCERRGIMLIYCAVPPAIRAALQRGGFLGGKHRAFRDLNGALTWCEDRMLSDANIDRDTGLASFEQWLQQQLGPGVKAPDLMAYLERKDTAGSEVLYLEGEPADTIDLVAIGNLTIDIADGAGSSLHVRRIMTHTVVGEMGFFRQSARSATVSSEGAATLFSLTRANFERMRRERPDLASAFYEFILRILADRVDVANRVVAALSRYG